LRNELIARLPIDKQINENHSNFNINIAILDYIDKLKSAKDNKYRQQQQRNNINIQCSLYNTENVHIQTDLFGIESLSSKSSILNMRQVESQTVTINTNDESTMTSLFSNIEMVF
jgi:hypothetical protein